MIIDMVKLSVSIFICPFWKEPRVSVLYKSKLSITGKSSGQGDFVIFYSISFVLLT